MTEIKDKIALKRRSKEEKEKLLFEIQKLGVVAGCRRYSVEPSTYYVWLERYQAHGINGLEDRRSQNHDAMIRKLEKENKILKELMVEKDLEIRMQAELLKKKMEQWKNAKK
jgi:putative transposase